MYPACNIHIIHIYTHTHTHAYIHTQSQPNRNIYPNPPEKRYLPASKWADYILSLNDAHPRRNISLNGAGFSKQNMHQVFGVVRSADARAYDSVPITKEDFAKLLRKEEFFVGYRRVSSCGRERTEKRMQAFWELVDYFLGADT